MNLKFGLFDNPIANGVALQSAGAVENAKMALITSEKVFSEKMRQHIDARKISDAAHDDLLKADAALALVELDRKGIKAAKKRYTDAKASFDQALTAAEKLKHERDAAYDAHQRSVQAFDESIAAANRERCAAMLDEIDALAKCCLGRMLNLDDVFRGDAYLLSEILRNGFGVDVVAGNPDWPDFPNWSRPSETGMNAVLIEQYEYDVQRTRDAFSIANDQAIDATNAVEHLEGVKSRVLAAGGDVGRVETLINEKRADLDKHMTSLGHAQEALHHAEAELGHMRNYASKLLDHDSVQKMRCEYMLETVARLLACIDAYSTATRLLIGVRELVFPTRQRSSLDQFFAQFEQHLFLFNGDKRPFNPNMQIIPEHVIRPKVMV